VFSGCYLNELLMRLLTRHDPHPGLFEVYEAALAQLEMSEEPALRVFEKRLLESLGYGLLLDHEADSDTPVSAEALYEYRLESGPVRCQSTDGSGIFIHGASLLALRDEVLLSGRACGEAKQLMRRALELYLGARPLKTREVLRQMSSLAGSERAETAHVN
jgi:DNA repair protein RecO (recombination protein O)